MVLQTPPERRAKMITHLSSETEKTNENNKTLSIRCRNCKSQNHTKQGYRQTQNRGHIQKYLCLDCHKYFTPDLGFWRMRNSESNITMSVDMYLSNLSSRKMRNQLHRHMSTEISHVSILDWVRRYTLKVHNYIESLSYNLGEEYFADETFIARNKQQDRFWACVDWETRFITGIHYSLFGNPKEAIEFLKKAISKKMPKYIQTDGAHFYPSAFRRLFYSNKKNGLKVEHKIQNVRRTHVHNYKIETVFMKIKDRVDDFRGLKAVWSAPILLAGITLQHNWIEEHTTTRKVPCEPAGHKLHQPNRWLELINLSSISVE